MDREKAQKHHRGCRRGLYPTVGLGYIRVCTSIKLYTLYPSLCVCCISIKQQQHRRHLHMGKSLTSFGWCGRTSSPVETHWLPEAGLFPLVKGMAFTSICGGVFGSTSFRRPAARVSSALASYYELLISTPGLSLTHCSLCISGPSPLQLGNPKALRKGARSQAHSPGRLSQPFNSTDLVPTPVRVFPGRGCVSALPKRASNLPV